MKGYRRHFLTRLNRCNAITAYEGYRDMHKIDTLLTTGRDGRVSCSLLWVATTIRRPAQVSYVGRLSNLFASDHALRERVSATTDSQNASLLND